MKSRSKLYPNDIEGRLGFNEIRDMLSSYCLTDTGKQWVQKLSWSNHYESLARHLRQTEEMLNLLREAVVPPLAELSDLEPLLDKFKVEGRYLLPEELLELMRALLIMRDLRAFVSEHEEHLPEITKLLADLEQQPDLLRSIQQVIDDRGEVRITASKELEELHWKAEGIRKGLEKRAQQIFNQARKAGHTEDTGPSIRDGRIVIPMLSEHRRKLRGVVLDESAQGRLVYVEPSELVELNNDLRELEMNIRREIQRVLRNLSAKIAPHRELFAAYNERIGRIDFIYARGRLGLELDARVPELQEETAVEWVNARHPLLLLHHRQLHKEVVPLNAALHPSQRILVISGPNAGGKSVCLKSFALLQYMFQCGLPVPCEEGSKAGIFKDLMVDIGDNQSIDNDLSSYTSHLQAMKFFADHVSERSLFCIDELGSGTDPQLGGPIAEGVLKWLNKRKAMGVVTTHFSSIKQFTGKQEGMKNASMAYDVEHLKPLYQLRIGTPGSSYAFEVADQIGLQLGIMKYARQHSPAKQQRVEELLTRLEKERTDLEFQREVLDQKEADLDRLLNDYKSLKEELKSSKKEILQQARDKASRTLFDANRRLEESLKQMRKEEKDKHRQMKEQLQKEEQQLKKAFESEEEEEVQHEYAEGDLVTLKGQQQSGVITSLKKKKAWVDFGGIQTVVQVTQLQPLKQSAQINKVKQVVHGIDLVSRQRSFSTEMDVRGQKAEDVLRELEQRIDNAVILGFNRLRIIHGKGHGILRKLIREHFRKHPFVERMEYENDEQGGEGVSIVYLK